MINGFIWYELLTSDPDAAARFYGAVVGWVAKDSGQQGMDYRYLTMNSVPVGGLMALPTGAAAAGMRPGWLGYIAVGDVDRSVARIVAAGGTVLMPATTLPGVGRIALVADPQGAAFYLMAPAGEGEATSFAPGKPGHGGWHELHARDWQDALAFYGEQFGWRRVHAMDMGPMGTYLQFSFGSGPMTGGMMNDAAAPRPYWLYCFNVDDIDAAHARLAGNGGEALMGPHEVPTGDWVIYARDPQGAQFVLVGPKR
jgi:predicted enzyme related to lactoylglutathione lyase